MPDPEKAPVFNILDSAESIYSKRKQFRIVLLWAIFASIWIISVSVLFGLFTFGPKGYQAIEIDIVVILAIFLGVPLFAAALFVLPYSWGSSKKIEAFMADFHPIWVKMQTEGESLRGGSEEQILTEIVKKLMPGYKNVRPSSKLSRKINERLSIFNIIKHKRKRLGIVKILESGESLGKENILELQKRTFRDVKSIGCKINFFAFVQDNYSNDFANWENEDALIENGAIVLFIARSGKWLTVKWVSPIKKGHY